jgi:imidazolonepropionase-like amidohydrolase
MLARLRTFVLLISTLTLLALLWPTFTSAQTQTLALIGATVYTSPTATPFRDSVVLAANGHITAVGKRGDVQIPKDAKVIDCSGKYLVAGFWNSHIHLSEPVFAKAGSVPAAPMAAHLREMLTKWGFTTAWDLGSYPADSLALRGRIESGEIPGPKLLLAGDIFPKGGHPVYLPAEMQLPEAGTPAEAKQMATDDLKMGLDGMKLFTGAFMGDKPVIHMETPIVTAAVDVAHAQHKPVFAHPQDRVGMDNAIDGGVDVLAHTITANITYTPDELARFKSQHTALIPTLSLWTTVVNDPHIVARILDSASAQLKAFSANGGTVLYGTDIGFIQIFDPTLDQPCRLFQIRPKGPG